jgi:hypothetical protein
MYVGLRVRCYFCQIITKSEYVDTFNLIVAPANQRQITAVRQTVLTAVALSLSHKF